MTVSELIKKLEQYPQDLTVITTTSEDYYSVLTPIHIFEVSSDVPDFDGDIPIWNSKPGNNNYLTIG